MKPHQKSVVRSVVRRVVAATGNAGKLAEIQALFRDLDVIVLAQSEQGIDAPEETGKSFTENALLKARHAAGASGLAAVADDSGLAVDALQGCPGVFSARYAGPAATDRENIDKLLLELEGLGDGERGAAFHCAAVFVAAADDPEPLIAEGLWPGRILDSRRGSGGFGYDPVFYVPETGKTAAEMTDLEKNRMSHRGQAFRRLAGLLVERGVLGRVLR